MRNTIFALIIAILPAVVFANSFNVNVRSESKETFSIDFSTVETFSSICMMHVNSLKIEKPAFGLDDGRANGLIEFSASSDPFAPCLAAFGPHHGTIVLAHGRRLPAVQKGTYKLVIGGENYGILSVNEDGVELKSDEIEEGEIEVSGTLKSGMMAIGGETTGVVLFADEKTYELNMDWTEARLLNGKLVYVKGILRIVQGVEIPVRHIIDVEEVVDMTPIRFNQ